MYFQATEVMEGVVATAAENLHGSTVLVISYFFNCLNSDVPGCKTND